jgi:ribosome-dependent ATPase
LLIDLSRKEGVTIFVSTHFMNEAERCDRISLMDSGRVLATDTPAGLIETRQADTLEEAFIGLLEEAAGTEKGTVPEVPGSAGHEIAAARARERASRSRSSLSLQRLAACTIRLELVRDPVRLGFAVLGTTFLMLVFGFGISTDVNSLSFAVLDHDHSHESRAYFEELRGSSYFVERPPLASYADLEKRLANGDIDAGLEIPAGFGRDIARAAGLGRRVDRRGEAVHRPDDPRLSRGHAPTLSGRPDYKDDATGPAFAGRYRSQV